MYNAATAVFLERNNAYPKTHGSIVGQFGLLVKDMPGMARDHGRALRESFELRLLADYDAGQPGWRSEPKHRSLLPHRSLHLLRL